MNSVRTIADEIKYSGKNAQIKFEGMKLLMDKMEGRGGENEKRATEIGPVLEEILHRHWDHWRVKE